MTDGCSEYRARISAIRRLRADPDDTVAREFYNAAVAGDLDKLKELLALNPDINVNAHLLDNSSDIDYSDEESIWNYDYIEPSESAISGAARKGHIEVVCLLLSLGANVNADSTLDHFVRSVLTDAVCSDNLDLVRLLLHHGADPDLRLFFCQHDDLSYHHPCFTTYDLNVLDLLLDHGEFDINETGESGSPILEEHYAKMHTRYYKHSLFRKTFAYRMVRGGVKWIRWAISRGLIVSDRLLDAVEPGDYETLRYLVLELGLKDSDFYPLSEIHTWRKGRCESFDQCLPAINLLLSTLSQDKIKQLPTVLCAAVESELGDVLKFWLDWGVDINGYSTLGLTALHQAIISFCRVDFVEMLLERGADVNRRTVGSGPVFYGHSDHGGSNALHLAYSRGGHTKAGVVEALLAAGVDREARNDIGSTPLHSLANFIGTETSGWSQVEETIGILRDCTGNIKDINAVNHEGKTALHCIAGAKGYLKYQKEAAIILAQRGIHPSIKDNEGMTAEDRFRDAHDVSLQDWIGESLCEAMDQKFNI
ncbi:hypothetical protein RB595_004718 [Gaeumannomyces hyphopodioides]